MKNKYLQTAKQILTSVQPLSTQQLLKQQYEMGIDQAGRGPVFGAMVYSSLWWPLIYKDKLEKIGFNDSKTVKEQDRQKMYQALEYLRGKMVFFRVEILSAEFISNKMLANPQYHNNLNEISHNSAISLIKNALTDDFKIMQVYLDTVGSEGKYEQKILNEISNNSIKVKVSKKADSIYKVVSAASIVAKVTRDKIINDWNFPEKIQTQGSLGSGYPGDPKTIDWLKKNQDQVFGYPTLIRFSWGTIDNIFQTKIHFKQEKQKKGFPNYLKRNMGIIENGKSIF